MVACTVVELQTENRRSLSGLLEYIWEKSHAGGYSGMGILLQIGVEKWVEKWAEIEGKSSNWHSPWNATRTVRALTLL